MGSKGLCLSQCLYFLSSVSFDAQMSPMNIHLIGHSMGGRVMGLVGQKLKIKVGRITGKCDSID